MVSWWRPNHGVGASRCKRRRTFDFSEPARPFLAHVSDGILCARLAAPFLVACRLSPADVAWRCRLSLTTRVSPRAAIVIRPSEPP